MPARNQGRTKWTRETIHMWNKQNLTSDIKHPNIDITLQAPQDIDIAHWAPKHCHQPSSTQDIDITHSSTQTLTTSSFQAPAQHPHLKTTFVGRYAQTSDQTQASMKQSHISSNPWTMPINLVYQPLSPMATSESIIYLFESRFSPLMKKGMCSKVLQTTATAAAKKVVNAKPKNHRGIPPTS